MNIRQISCSIAYELATKFGSQSLNICQSHPQAPTNPAKDSNINAYLPVKLTLSTDCCGQIPFIHGYNIPPSWSWNLQLYEFAIVDGLL